MLSPASQQARRERLLLMGPFGSGKTTAWLNVAKWAAQTQSPAQFYALDTDNALDAFFEPGSQYAHLDARNGGNVHWTPAFEWPEYEAWIDAVMPRLGPDDWMMIDFVSTAWEAVQTYYVDQVFGQEPGEFFLQARKNMKGGNPLDGWKDWQYINKLYKTWINKVLHRTGGHKLLTAQSESLRESDDRAVRAMFGAYGVRPRGQKELGYQTHTILLTGIGREQPHLTTIKDRERNQLDALPHNEFTVDYLVNVAGWSL